MSNMFSLYALRRAVSVLQHVPQFSGKVRQPVKIYSAAGVDSNMSSISSMKYLYQVSSLSNTSSISSISSVSSVSSIQVNWERNSQAVQVYSAAPYFTIKYTKTAWNKASRALNKPNVIKQMISFIWSKVDSSLKHVGQNVGHQKYLEETYGKRVRVSFPSLWVSVEERFLERCGETLPKSRTTLPFPRYRSSRITLSDRVLTGWGSSRYKWW